MVKVSQGKVINSRQTRQLTARLSTYREIFMGMAYRSGLTIEEVALIFAMTKQNAAIIIKKDKKFIQGK